MLNKEKNNFNLSGIEILDKSGNNTLKNVKNCIVVIL
jgi:hypothetical protein